MCINKECKEYIIRPSGENMNRTALFLPIRAKAIKNLETQLFADSKAKTVSTQTSGLLTNDPEVKKHEVNVKAQIDKIHRDSKVFPTFQAQGSSTELRHLFKSQEIRPEQAHDICNFRGIGLNTLQQYINHYILRTPSVKPPRHKKSLLTFTERSTRQKKGSSAEKERKIQLEVWKKRVSFAASTGFQYNISYQQCIELPRAIATTDGNLVKGTKANSTKFYEKRYGQVTPPIIKTSQQSGWVPDVVVMEGMFLINISPWSAHKTMGDYANFLLKQHIQPFLRNTTTLEVHLLFDSPESQQCTPKYFERMHRDEMNQTVDDHYCADSFSADLMVPPKWKENVLSCRRCKRKLVCFLSEYFLQKIRPQLRPNQTFVTAGGLKGDCRDKALQVTSGHPPTINHMLSCNADESDTRIWLHVLHSPGTRKLVLSPDTDVYHIGLPVIAPTNLDVLVRLSTFSSIEQRFLDLQALLKSIRNDPDLASVDQTKIALIFQTLFIAKGCDYISFFHGIGKATFLGTLYQYSEFITAGTTAPGTLTNKTNGFFSFCGLLAVHILKVTNLHSYLPFQLL